MNRIEEIKENSKSYLTFQIGEELFAVHVGHINNILEVPEITTIPQTPDYVMGVINLRGTVLPVIDTRVKLNMEETKVTTQTCILVQEVNQNGQVIPVGAMVDKVHEVIEIEKDQIKPPPAVKGLKETNKLFSGMIHYSNKFILLLDVDHLFDDVAISNLQLQIEAMKEAVE